MAGCREAMTDGGGWMEGRDGARGAYLGLLWYVSLILM